MVIVAGMKLPNKSLNLTPENVSRARRHRKYMGASERVLWERLRKNGTGFRFRRQHPVGPYLLDFYCPEAMLAVEVDGSSHLARVDADARRDQILSGLGVLTFRLPSLDLFEDTRVTGAVWIEQITKLCEERSGRLRWQRSAE